MQVSLCHVKVCQVYNRRETAFIISFLAILHTKPHAVKGSTLKGKNLLPRGANSFLLEETSFQKGDNLMSYLP